MFVLNWAFIAFSLAGLYLVKRTYGLWILEVCARVLLRLEQGNPALCERLTEIKDDDLMAL